MSDWIFYALLILSPVSTLAGYYVGKHDGRQEKRTRGRYVR